MLLLLLLLLNTVNMIQFLHNKNEFKMREFSTDYNTIKFLMFQSH
jgi:hypothetical protein